MPPIPELFEPKPPEVDPNGLLLDVEPVRPPAEDDDDPN